MWFLKKLFHILLCSTLSKALEILVVLFMAGYTDLYDLKEEFNMWEDK